MELWQRFTSPMRRLVLHAHDLAQKDGTLITTAHLALAMLDANPQIETALEMSPAALREALRQQAAGAPRAENEPSFTPDAQRVLLRALKVAKDAGAARVATEHFAAGLLREGSVRELLREAGLAPEQAVEVPEAPVMETIPALAVPPPSPAALAPGDFRKVFEVPGRYVNDHCLIRHDGQWHLFTIDGEVGKGCYDLGNETIIGHATAPDMFGPWQAQEPALVHDPALPWEERGIFAPYVIGVGDPSHGDRQGEAGASRYAMFYASHNLAGAQYMCLATSNDLVHWQRHDNPLLVPSRSWAYWDEMAPTSCRDAHVIPHEEHGYIMYWVGDMDNPRDHSCIAASVSRDLIHWQEIGPVLIRHHSDLEAITCKTESPCVIHRDGRWYLFYRHGNGTKVCVSHDPLDFHGRDSVLFSTAHAAEIVEFDGQWYVTNCSRPPEDIQHREDRRHGLWVARMDWKDGWPVVE